MKCVIQYFESFLYTRLKRYAIAIITTIELLLILNVKKKEKVDTIQYPKANKNLKT